MMTREMKIARRVMSDMVDLFFMLYNYASMSLIRLRYVNAPNLPPSWSEVATLEKYSVRFLVALL